MTQKPPDFLMILFCVATMIMVAIMGFALIGCSTSFHRETGKIDGNTGSKTHFTMQTKM